MLETIGLGGDGDEVDAIERVERHFGIVFDYDDCEGFVTVGDVWRALVKELRVDEAEVFPRWPELVEALGEETLDRRDYGAAGFETRLLV